MSTTPAGELARLKTTYPKWEITRKDGVHVSGNSAGGWSTAPTFTAVERAGTRILTDSTAPGLESQLIRASAEGNEAP
jgi:hypothetical protein